MKKNGQTKRTNSFPNDSNVLANKAKDNTEKSDTNGNTNEFLSFLLQTVCPTYTLRATQVPIRLNVTSTKIEHVPVPTNNSSWLNYATFTLAKIIFSLLRARAQHSFAFSAHRRTTPQFYHFTNRQNDFHVSFACCLVAFIIMA